MLGSIAFVWVLSAPALELSINDASFALNGKPVFLLGASYYGALGIEDEAVVAGDLDELRSHAFNWIRAWATWDAFENNVSAVGRDGHARLPYMKRLKRLCRLARERGMVVDVTVSRGKSEAFPSNQSEHLAVMKTLAAELVDFRNAYFDVGNERNIGDARHTPMDDVAGLIKAVKSVDPRRLCTASHGGDIGPEEVRAYIDEGKVDFLSPHRPRSDASPRETEAKTREYLSLMKSASRIVPVHYQEPFRRDYAEWNPDARDFWDDLNGARAGGAAGWCFHNGSAKKSPDNRPRRSFDMRPAEGPLFSQFDGEEKAFLAELRESMPHVIESAPERR